MKRFIEGNWCSSLEAIYTYKVVQLGELIIIIMTINVMIHNIWKLVAPFHFHVTRGGIVRSVL